MIVFTAGGALHDAFAARHECRRVSIRERGAAGVVAALSDGDVLVHNAAAIAVRSLADALASNFDPTRALVDALVDARDASGKRVTLVALSSMSFLGRDGRPLEALDMSPYAFSKYVAEAYCLKSGVDARAVRFSTLFYRDPKRDGLSAMIATAVAKRRITLLGGGGARRDFLPLSVAVDYLRAIATPTSGPGVYTLAAGVSTSFREVAEMVCEAVPDTSIEDAPATGTPPFVPYEFDAADVERLGRIRFDLRDHVRSYAASLA
ncbi:MAG: NAD-dependent epimerase/dehydratase family protein [Polyangiales bacterium]